MEHGLKKYLILLGLVILSALPIYKIWADNSAGSASSSTLTIAQQKQLEQQLQQIQDQINQLQQQLTGIQSQKNTLSNKLKQLKAQQAKITLQIQATTLNIQNIQSQLTQTQANINSDIQEVANLKGGITQIINAIYQNDHYPLVEALFSEQGFSGFYDQLNSEQQITQNLSDLIAKVKADTAQLQDDQKQLSDQYDQQQNYVAIQNLQNAQLGQSVSDQNTLLQQTKGKESDYQIAINDSKQQAAQIQNRLYQLLGINTQVTFGQALQIAQWANSQTGVRPAFLLAILTQESNLGKNVGTCNRPGDPPSKSWKVVMKPDRDQQPFLQITVALNLDPNITPVSCPMRDSKGNQVGWGGAMGPAQFIPSTWLGYEGKVSAITGKTANPWDIRDAFLASAIKLAADGGASQSGEWAAAMKYFSGSTNPKYSFYGDSVVATAAKYQSDVNQLGQQGTLRN